jgi:hypothetical protein
LLIATTGSGRRLLVWLKVRPEMSNRQKLVARRWHAECGVPKEFGADQESWYCIISAHEREGKANVRRRRLQGFT